jgi:hypothetical protein
MSQDDESSKCFGFVNRYDTKPKRRLFEMLKSQGMQMNQAVTFLSDGGDTVRAAWKGAKLRPGPNAQLDRKSNMTRQESIPCFLQASSSCKFRRLQLRSLAKAPPLS